MKSYQIVKICSKPPPFHCDHLWAYNSAYIRTCPQMLHCERFRKRRVRRVSCVSWDLALPSPSRGFLALFLRVWRGLAVSRFAVILLLCVRLRFRSFSTFMLLSQCLGLSGNFLGLFCFGACPRYLVSMNSHPTLTRFFSMGFVLGLPIPLFQTGFSVCRYKKLGFLPRSFSFVLI